MLDKTSSIICAFGLASAAPRSPYRHLELCGIALENGNHRTVIGGIDVILHGLAGQGSNQCLDGGLVLVAFFYNQQVGVGLGSFRGCILNGQGVLAGREASSAA